MISICVLSFFLMLWATHLYSPPKTLLAKKLTMQIFCCKLETPIKNPAGAAHHWDR